MEQTGANIPPIKVYPDKFAGQVVLVTGAAQGIGNATATLFAAQGATVVLVDLNEKGAEEAAAKIKAAGGQASSRKCDVAIDTEVNSLIEEVISSFGKIDVLANIAGIYPFVPIVEYKTETYQKVMKVNIDSCFFLTRAVLPHMNKAGYGRIINTASNTMQVPLPGLTPYVASKSAVTGFTRGTATEAGPGVTANVVAPGLIKTETTWQQNINPDGSRPVFDLVMQRQCVKRMGRPEDIAHTISFIASPEAEFITGQTFDVGGGMSFH